MNLSLRLLIPCLILLNLCQNLAAQDFNGLAHSNYAGIYGLYLQPASIADSRYKLQINLLGMHVDAANNYLYTHRRDLMHGYRNVPDSAQVFELPGNQRKDVFFRLNAYMPGIMFNLKGGRGFALTTRVRSMFNVYDVNSRLAHQIWDDRKNSESLWGVNMNIDKMSAQMLNFTEVGLSYAQPVLNQNEHFLKVGGTAKMLLGALGSYMYVHDMNVQFNPTTQQRADTLQVNASGRLDYGYSDNFIASKNVEGHYTYRYTASPSFGLDLGAVYEWRPDWQKYRYDMDGKTNLERPDLEKYKLRAGFSMLDFGGVRFKQGIYSRQYYMPAGTILNVGAWDTLKNIQQFDDTIAKHGQVIKAEKYFSIKLPLALSLQADYNIWKGLYVNLTTYNYVRRGERGIRQLNQYSVTPRYDMRHFSVGVPLSVNGWGNFNAGLAFRLGPIFIGSNSALNFFLKDKLNLFDFYLAGTIPIYKKMPKDRDQDKVSDRLDECRDVPGLWAFKGCPDTDGDGIQDSQDDCPTEAGIPEFNGCPDRDGDGIMDKEDNCPDKPGLAQFSGCPDRDRDGVQDAQDTCPDIAGLVRFQGCPDRDQDSIPDRLDRCPDIAGLAHFKGCPDRDGDNIPDPDDSCATLAGLPQFSGCPDTDIDGVEDRKDECPTKPGSPLYEGCPDTDGDGTYDNRDACPDQFGPASNKGCPLRDTDRDGIPDKDDNCPTEPGTRENNGCPKVEQDTEVQEILKTAFENLEFASGKAIISNTSYPSLLELVNVLKKRPKYHLHISGHTDNVGDDRSNQQLSEDRAYAVKKFLTDNGIEPERIIAEGFGETRPIAPNTTPEGRAKNRRVELEVLMEPR